MEDGDREMMRRMRIEMMRRKNEVRRIGMGRLNREIMWLRRMDREMMRRMGRMERKMVEMGRMRMGWRLGEWKCCCWCPVTNPDLNT